MIRTNMLTSSNHQVARHLQHHQRPVIKPVITSVPVIDFSHLRSDAARSVAVQDIGNACRYAGCFEVVNHGIEESVIGGAMEVARRFFEMEEEMERLASEDLRRPVRFQADSCRSMLKQYAHPQSEWVRYWPSSPLDYRDKMGNYAAEARRVALQVLGAIFESLGLGEGYLKSELDEGLQLLVVNCYPRLTCANRAIGMTSHTDPGYITTLVQNCEGLQVMGNNREVWKAVPTNPCTLHIQVGDYLEVLSNGRYKSLMHRAMLNPTRERISITSIQNLASNMKVEIAAEMVDKHHPVRYRECSFSDFLDHLSSNMKGQSFLDTVTML